MRSFYIVPCQPCISKRVNIRYTNYKLHLNASIVPTRHLADSVRSPTRLPKCNGGQVFITHTIKNHHSTFGVEYIFIVLSALQSTRFINHLHFLSYQTEIFKSQPKHQILLFLVQNSNQVWSGIHLKYSRLSHR